jgi:hypothetical protein
VKGAGAPGTCVDEDEEKGGRLQLLSFGASMVFVFQIFLIFIINGRDERRAKVTRG